MKVPERGDLVYAQFNPQAGHEQAGQRPGIVLSPEIFNKATGFTVICPITNQIKGYPFEVALPSGLAISGVVLTDQVKSLNWRARNFQVLEKAPQETIDDCLALIHTFL